MYISNAWTPENQFGIIVSYETKNTLSETLEVCVIEAFSIIFKILFMLLIVKV